MSNIVLEAKKRDINVKKKKLLSNFTLPAVLYWKSTEPQAIELGYQNFRKALATAWQWQVITLNVDWSNYNVLIKSYDLDLVKNTFTHVDFLAVDKGSKVVAKIPIELYWESDAVRLWAILTQKMATVKVRCKVEDLPVSFKANIKKLVNPSCYIYVSDLEWIDKIEPLVDLWLIVAWLIVPRAVSAAEATSTEWEWTWTEEKKEWEAEWKK